MTHRSPDPESELARLADGSLSAADEAELRARVDASPELGRALAEQERGVTMLRELDDPAPAALRMRIESMSAPSPAGSLRPRRTGFAVATAMAIVAAAVLVGLPGRGPTAPSVPQTARLALAPAITGAPAEDRTHRGLLAVAVDRVPFPYWHASFGWRAVGARADVLGSRRIVTVYYASSTGARVGYSIVAGPALSTSGGRGVTRHGVRFTLIRDGNLQIVTWLRSGHSCVLAGRRVQDATLLRLATGEARPALSA